MTLPRERSALQLHTPSSNRMRDVLDRLLANIVIGEREFVSDMVVNCARYANAARLGEALQPSGDIHPIPINLFALHHHVAQVDADAKMNPALRRQIRILRLQRSLDLNGAVDSLNYTGKLGQNTVASGADEAAMVPFDKTIDDFAVRG